VSAEIITLKVDDTAAGARIDAFLASRIQLSRTRIQRAIEDGDVLVNDRPTKSSYRLRAGDAIEIELIEPPALEIAPEAIPLRIVFEDDDLIVVDKPAGMVVHPGAGIDSGTLANALVYHFNQLSGAAGRIRPGIVHRIDKETSGLLMAAKNDLAHEKLSDQFRDRKVFKMYTALVYGRVKEDRKEITAPIGRSPRNRTRMAALAGGAGRAAHTVFEVRARYSEFTLLDVEIKTGRTHQIRVHLAHINHPVAADRIYGAGRENGVRDAEIKKMIKNLNRHFLHSSRLAFTHPRSGARMEFHSPLPAELAALIESLK
jgi:23S rRNA pseudouridine1911/1915/1917 synthase